MSRLILLAVVFTTTGLHADEFDYFENKIRPILVNHCYECHNDLAAEGNLRLDLRTGLLKGGNAGPAIVPGSPSKSLLLKAIRYEDSELKMPPEDAGGKLSDEQIMAIEQWVRRGANDPRDGTFENDIERSAKDHWAFQPLEQIEIPNGQHPIDYLLGLNLHAKEFQTTERADRRTLIRRIAFDLTGLPPTLVDLDTPMEDLPKLVEQYLASPKYGERWARHWLDVARYSDAKDGVLMYGDARIRPFAYTYRDYVIRAFNEDTPFDDFVREQLAADQLQLASNSPKHSAMGFLTLGRLFDNNIHDVIDDQIDVVSRGFLGLTVSCARCHDHKFDPIPTADYYSLYGVFANSEEPYERPRVSGVTDEGMAFEQAYQDKLNEITQRQNKLYMEVLQDARYRTTQHLVKAATTKATNLETTIFFLSLTKDQLRPQITYAWRQYLAENAIHGHRVFGPWADLMNGSPLQPEQWAMQGVEPRVIKKLVEANPKTPAEVATAYGDLLTSTWSQKIDLERQIKTTERQLTHLGKGIINLADLIAGGDGLGQGEAGKAVNPVTGKTETGSTSSINSGTFDKYILAENPYVDGVFIPQRNATQIVSSTGISISDAPTGVKTLSWDYIRYGASQGSTTSVIDGIDYSVKPNWLMGMHSNKGVTIDLAAIRNLHGFESGVFKAMVGHGGAKGQSTIDVAIYLDGQAQFQHVAFEAQQAGAEISIPFTAKQRFLTLLFTEGKDGNSHDQGILGNPRFEVGDDQAYKIHITQQKSRLTTQIDSLRLQHQKTPDPEDDELAQILLSPDSPVWFPKRRLYFYLDRQNKDSFRGLLGTLDSIAVAAPKAADRAMVMVDKSEITEPVIFQRGDPSQPGSPVPRRFLQFLSKPDHSPFSNGAGRLELADAIADPSNPLTPRVWANRVWMHHFGSPLVEDPSDLGLRNDLPLQHHLLDYLASYLIKNNYQTKPLHRLILSSDAFQRSSLITDDERLQQQLNSDPQNNYYWRFNRRRLDLEQMRDTLLTISGLLDDTMFGRPVAITADNNNRRTIYAFVERQNLPTIIQVFDAANADSSTSRRPSTTVPQQALFALNSPFIHRMATALTERIDSDNKVEQVTYLYELTYGRVPTTEELTLGTTFLQTNEILDYAQVLLISNELWFVD